jgi:hypothetical protein
MCSTITWAVCHVASHETTVDVLDSLDFVHHFAVAQKLSARIDDLVQLWGRALVATRFGESHVAFDDRPLNET